MRVERLYEESDYFLVFQQILLEQLGISWSERGDIVHGDERLYARVVHELHDVIHVAFFERTEEQAVCFEHLGTYCVVEGQGDTFNITTLKEHVRKTVSTRYHPLVIFFDVGELDVNPIIDAYQRSFSSFPCMPSRAWSAANGLCATTR